VQLAVALACALVLRMKWSSMHAFVAAIDHGDVLFADFVNHYYPTVQDGLRQGAPAGGFFYPAAFAALLSPLALASPAIAKVLWGIVQLGCLGYASTALVQAVAPRRPVLALVGTALTVTSIPVLHNLKWGQVSLPILAAVGGAFVLRSRGAKNLPAALLGIAAGIKGYPIVFLAWFVARRDLRFFVRAAVASLITLVVLPAVVMGPAHALFFQRVSTGAVMGAADGVLRDFNSQYAPAVLARYHGGWDAAAVDVRAMGELGAFAALVVVAALVVLVAASSAPRIAERRELLAFVLIACTVPFWLRTSWSHYFVHLPLAQILVTAMLADREHDRDSPRARARTVLVLALLIAPSVFLSNVLGLFVTEGWWYYANAGSLFFANALVLLACAGVVVDTHVLHASQTKRQRPRALESAAGVG
jgi:hypothetical protein